MEDIESAPPTPNPRKRAAPEDTPSKRPLNLKGTQFMMPTPPDTEESSDASPVNSLLHGSSLRATSPAPSCSTLTSMDTASVTLPHGASSATGAAPAASGAPPPKRRKLTPAEKLEKQQEKELRAREKAEEKAHRDEERARKDEEKRVKDLDRQKKAEEREVKRREKELEEERKVQEKLKKERSQMRLGAFFQAKPVSLVTTESSTEAPGESARRKSVSLEPPDVPDNATSPAKGTPAKPVFLVEKKLAKVRDTLATDYHKTFLPFVLPSHTTLATASVCDGAPSDVTVFEHEIAQNCASESPSIACLKQYFPAQPSSQRGLKLPTVKVLADLIDGPSTSQVIDLTKDARDETPTELLRRIPIKHIHFMEDVRPPYCGTYTKVKGDHAGRAPFSRVRPDTDYNYDSEAEWEEPEEGEDIVSEDEDDADSQGDADEIEGFLDDSEDALKNKRRMITGDLVPESTGLCWQNPTGRFDNREVRDQMSGTRLGILVAVPSRQSINPFSAEYWQVEETVAKAEVAVTSGQKTLQGGVLGPPRAPLLPRVSGNAGADRTLIGAAKGEKGPITSVEAATGAKRGRKPAPRTLSKEDMEEFKDAVIGSTLGKLDLLKGLKSRFPKMTQDVIKDTLGHCFAQIGTSKADKRWVFVSAP